MSTVLNFKSIFYSSYDFLGPATIGRGSLPNLDDAPNDERACLSRNFFQGLNDPRRVRLHVVVSMFGLFTTTTDLVITCGARTLGGHKSGPG